MESKNWQTDIAAFDRYLAELAATGEVPDKQALAKRITLAPGERSLKSEVIPVTDGAGGFIDLSPGKDTVQFRVNEALKGTKVTWEYELRSDAIESFAGVFGLAPKLTNDDGAVSALSTVFVQPADPGTHSYDFKAGDIVKLEGTIGDFAENNDIAASEPGLATSFSARDKAHLGQSPSGLGAGE